MVPANRPDKPGKIKKIALDQLQVDREYQRLLKKKMVDEYAAIYNDMLVGVLEVSEREDGSYFVMDGQHRAEIMRRVEKSHAMCNTHLGLTRQDEAWFFRYYNKKRKQITQIEDWNASLFEGDPETLAIKEVIERHGLVVAGHTSPRTISAVWTLRHLHRVREGGVDLIDRVLTLSQGAWAEEDSCNEGELLMGVALVIRKYGDEMSDKRAIRQWERKWTPRKLIGAASDHKYNFNISKQRAVAEMLVRAYDAGLSPSKRLVKPDDDDLDIAA